MVSLADIVRRHGPSYRRRHGAAMLPSHVRALADIEHCRTPALGGHLAKCTACGSEHLLYHSCRNRACPRCGQDRANRWLTKQRERLLPVQYYHVVFTLPAELRRVVRTHQKALLGALFRAAFDSLAALCRDPHFLGAEIGALAVLHTWTRTLEWHPHVHLLVPGGGLAADGRTWCQPPQRKTPFLVPVKALAKLFRGRFLALARRALPGVTLPHIPWGKRWVVFAKPTVQGSDRVLAYLGRYVQRTALSERALLACDDRTVTFRYKDSRDQKTKTMTLPAEEFLRRFLQHVPAKGFHRVRAFGLLHAEHKQTVERLHLLLASATRHDLETAPAPPPPQKPGSRICPTCGEAAIVLLRRVSALECMRLEGGALLRLTQGARAPPALCPIADQVPT